MMIEDILKAIDMIEASGWKDDRGASIRKNWFQGEHDVIIFPVRSDDPDAIGVVTPDSALGEQLTELGLIPDMEGSGCWGAFT